jgi:hypothetical protein
MSSTRQSPGDQDDTMALCAGGASLPEFLAEKFEALSLPAGRLSVCWYCNLKSEPKWGLG